MLVSLVNAAIVLFGGHYLHLDGTKQGALNMVAAALVTLVVVIKAHKDKTAAAIYGLIQVVVAAVVAFGLALDGALQADIMTFAGFVLMYFTRQSITAPVDENGLQRTI